MGKVAEEMEAMTTALLVQLPAQQTLVVEEEAVEVILLEPLVDQV